MAAEKLKFNKFYIGLARDKQFNNFAIFRLQKIGVRVVIRMQKSEEIEEKINESGIDLMDYDSKNGRYRIRLGRDDIKKKHDVILELLKNSYSQAMNL